MARNVWTDASPYGTYAGERGNPDQWRKAFNEKMGYKEAKKVIKDSDPHTILGVELGASLAEIKKAYRKLISIHHPDKGGDESTAKKIIASYTVLIQKG